MYCPNCGAFYPGEKEYHCPYCLSENPNMVAKKRAEILKEYDVNEKQLSETMYEERSKKMSKKISGTFVKVLIVFVCVVLIILLGINIIGAIGNKREDKTIEELEAYYMQKDWAGLELYMEGHNITSSDYAKYKEIKMVYGECELVYMYFDSICTYAQTGAEVDWNSESGLLLKEDMKSAISWAASAYKIGTNDIEDVTLLGNEGDIEEILQEMIDFLEGYGVTEEELEYLSTLTLSNPDEETKDEIASRILEQIFETE